LKRLLRNNLMTPKLRPLRRLSLSLSRRLRSPSRLPLLRLRNLVIRLPLLLKAPPRKLVRLRPRPVKPRMRPKEPRKRVRRRRKRRNE